MSRRRHLSLGSQRKATHMRMGKFVRLCSRFLSTLFVRGRCPRSRGGRRHGGGDRQVRLRSRLLLTLIVLGLLVTAWQNLHRLGEASLPGPVCCILDKEFPEDQDADLGLLSDPHCPAWDREDSVESVLYPVSNGGGSMMGGCVHSTDPRTSIHEINAAVLPSDLEFSTGHPNSRAETLLLWIRV